MGQCPPAGFLIYSTQAEVNEFAGLYPNCKMLSGLTLNDSASDPIIDLGPLSNLDSLGNLSILDLTDLVDLSGLENLGYIGTLRIEDNLGLESLKGLENLIKIGQNLSVGYNENLEVVDNLLNLDTIGGSLTLRYNPILNDISGFDNVKSIGKDFIYNNNPSIINFDGFHSLVYLGEDFDFRSPDLVSFNGFQKLEELNDALEFFDLNSLVTVTGFESLRAINGRLLFSVNPLLSSLPDFQNLKFVSQNLDIFQNGSLGTIDNNFPLLDSVGYNINITFNSALQSISDFNSLKTVNVLAISSNGITSLSGFENVIDAEVISIDQNEFLTQWTGFSSLESMTGEFLVNGNDALVSIPTFPEVKRIDGRIYINENASLLNLNSFPELLEVGNNIGIQSNDKLEHCNSFAKLKTALNISYVWNNELLTVPSFDELEVCNSLDLRYDPKLEEFVGMPKLLACQSMLVTDNGITNFNITGPVDSTSLFIRNNPQLVSIQGFNNLTQLPKGHIENNILLTSIPSFNNVTGAGSIEILKNVSLPVIDAFDNLLAATEHILIRENDLLESISGFSAIKSIGGQAYQSLLIGLNPILTVIPSFNSLETAEAIRIYNTGITEINGFNNLIRIETNPTSNSLLHFTGNTALTSIDGFQKLEFIQGEVLFEKNPLLTSIPTFDMLREVTHDFEIKENLLGDLSGFAALNRIGGDMVFRFEDGIKSLPHFHKLKSINGNLEIALDSLENVEGFYNLESINGNLQLFGTQVSSLSGFQSIDPNSIANIYISQNEKLEICGVQSICAYISIRGSAPGIKDNAVGCNSDTEIDCIGNSISGTVFYDFDMDKNHDANEPGIGNIMLDFRPDNKKSISRDDGLFFYYPDADKDYVIFPELGNDWVLTTDSMVYNVDYVAGSQDNHNKDFGIVPIFSKHEAMLSIHSLPTRCNTEVDFTFNFKNTGTFEEEGLIRFNIDPTASYVSAYPVPDSIDNNSLFWYYDELLPYTSAAFEMILAMPDENATGDPLLFSLETFRTENGSFIPYATADYTPVVLCSFDPNDKLVMPSGHDEENTISVDQRLHYTIRFQNLGNAEAIDIRILDTLDVNLNVQSIQITDSSFPVHTTISGNIVDFFFENIWLQSSQVNEPASHGYVSFEISPLNGVAPGEEISNEAGIYFDFNPPIQTNEVINTVEKEIVLALEDIDFILSKEGNTSIIEWNTFTNQADDIFIVGHSLDGKKFNEIYQSIANQNTAISNYHFVHYSPSSGDNYYRIKKRENSGDEFFSNIKSLFFEQAVVGVQVYPNPASDIIQISLDNSFDLAIIVELLNEEGKMVSSYLLDPNKSLHTLQIAEMPAGFYFLKVYLLDQVIVKKISIIK